jgi:hypothetical protein
MKDPTECCHHGRFGEGQSLDDQQMLCDGSLAVVVPHRGWRACNNESSSRLPHRKSG